MPKGKTKTAADKPLSAAAGVSWQHGAITVIAFAALTAALFNFGGSGAGGNDNGAGARSASSDPVSLRFPESLFSWRPVSGSLTAGSWAVALGIAAHASLRVAEFSNPAYTLQDGPLLLRGFESTAEISPGDVLLSVPRSARIDGSTCTPLRKSHNASDTTSEAVQLLQQRIEAEPVAALRLSLICELGKGSSSRWHGFFAELGDPPEVRHRQGRQQATGAGWGRSRHQAHVRTRPAKKMVR